MFPKVAVKKRKQQSRRDSLQQIKASRPQTIEKEQMVGNIFGLT